MLDISNNVLYKLKINATKVDFLDRFRCALYSTYLGKDSWGMKKKYGHTIHIDLTKSAEEILQDFKSNTRNEVRRAIREDFFFEPVTDLQEFVEFYNNFAQEKSLETISLGHLTKYGKNVIMYRAGVNGTTLCMHASTLDDDVKIAALLYSASVRLDQGIEKKSVGFANRFLHYKEFIAFKEKGYKKYDFSGVCIDESQPEKYSIGLFKKSFGGEEITSVELKSYPMLIIQTIKELIFRLK